MINCPHCGGDLSTPEWQYDINDGPNLYQITFRRELDQQMWFEWQYDINDGPNLYQITFRRELDQRMWFEFWRNGERVRRNPLHDLDRDTIRQICL